MTDLLMVGVGVMGRPYLGAAARLGCQVRAVETTAGPEAAGVKYYRIGNGVEESWLAGVAQAVAEQVPDGIIAFAEPHVLAGALAQDQLSRPGPSLRAAVISRNKALQRAQCGGYGLPQPDYLLTPDLRQARDWLLEHLPVVVKPVDRSGSEGVELVTTRREADQLLERRAGEGKLLVERAVDGPEYSWEALVQDGEVRFENITAKETTPPPYFVELCHRCGHRFPPPVAAQVQALTRGVLQAIGMRTGLVHLEFRVAATGPVLMEVAVRTPGDYLTDAVGLAFEVDLYQAMVELALGRPPDSLAGRPPGGAPRSYSATLFLTCPPGRISRISGDAEVRAHPAVRRVWLRRQPGDVVAPLTSSDQRLGHVLVNAGSPEEREEALAFARERLRFSVDGGDRV